MAMTPIMFADQIRQALPTGVRAIVLYGSAVTGDHLGEKSDFNVLLVLDQIGLAELKALSGPTAAWVKAGNHPPLMFTAASLQEAADVFPIELLDIRDAHKVLSGDDVVHGLVVNDAHLRLQVEHELRGKLIQLQAQFLLTGLKPKVVAALLTGSVSKFLILLRAALRLYVKTVPAQKLAAMHVLAQHVAFDTEALVIVQELKEGRRKLRELQPEALFERYVRAIEAVTQAVNDWKKGTGI